MRAGAAGGHGGTLKPTQALREAGQSLWLDNITRALLDEGILARYVAEYSVTVSTMPDQTLEAFAASWQDLLARIGARHGQLARTS
jgi:transaldolase